MPRGLKERRSLQFFLSGSTLIAYLAILIYSNYHFQARLAKSLHEQFKMQNQIAVGVVQSFFDVRKFEMADLLASRELTAYFENKALGMSELYGLKQSLALVHARFLKLMDRKQATGGTLYQRIALYDAEGALLTDTSPESTDTHPPEQAGISFLSSPDNANQRVIYSGGNEILLVTPWVFKGKPSGGIVAWLKSSTVLGLTEDQMRASGMQWQLMARTSDGYRPVVPDQDGSKSGGDASPQDGSRGFSGKDDRGQGTHFASYSTTMTDSSIPGTPFILSSMIPSGQTLGWNFPTASTYGLVALAVAVLLGLLVFLRVNEETVAMTVRLQESEKSSARIKEKNARLQEEIEYRNEAEQKLAASEKLLASVITGAQVGIWDWNIQTGEARFNERWAEMIGCHLRDLEPLSIETWKRMCHPGDLERANESLDQLFDGRIKHHECEVRMRHALGYWVWVLDRGMVVEWDEHGRPLRASGTYLDISERKQAEEARAESEQRLQAILHAMPDSMVLVDRDHTILWANEMCFAVHGKTVLGKKSWEVCLNRPSACEMCFSPREDGKWSVYEQETVVTGPGGSQRMVLHMAAVVSWDQEGAPEKLIELFRDITEKKHLEEQLRQKQKMEAVGQLTGGVAHDLNNILQAVNGYTELALMALPPDSPVKATLSNVVNAGERGARLVSQLLAFSRRQVMKLANLNLKAVTTDLLDMLKCIIGEKVRLEFLPEPNLWSVFADCGMFEQILLNLCINARDAMPDGGAITIRFANATVTEADCERYSLKSAGPYVVLSVTDTGCGMDADVLSRIFEPFYTTKALGKGTGLGLSTVYGNVKQHGGTVLVSSKPGHGSKFEVYLPAIRQDFPEEIVKGASAKTAKGTGETVLLAEDDAPIRMLGRTLLEHAGYRVLEACDGKEAVEVYKQNAGQIDVLLFDMMMPNMDGQEAYTAVHAMNPDIPVIFASGYSMNSLNLDFFEDKNIALVQKPFRSFELLATLRTILETKAGDSRKSTPGGVSELNSEEGEMALN